MKSTILTALFCLMGLSSDLFSQESEKRESINIETTDLTPLVKGTIHFEAHRIEGISSANGFVFKCYCYMHGQREFTAELEGDFDIKSADQACKKFEGALYQDLGVSNRSGRMTYSVTRSCSSMAESNPPARR